MTTVPDALQTVIDHIDAVLTYDKPININSVRVLKQRIVEQRAQAIMELNERRVGAVKP